MKTAPFKAIYPKKLIKGNYDSFFNAMSRKFDAFYRGHKFHTTSDQHFYIYIITYQNRNHMGIVVANDLQDFIDGNIHKHETIIQSKTRIIKRAITDNNHQIKPLLLGYEPNVAIDRFLESLDLTNLQLVSVDFNYGEKHALYCIKEKSKLDLIQHLFEEVKDAFIADGHHRSEATQQYLKEHNEVEKSILCAYFSFDHLRILPFHRSLKFDDNIGPLDFIDQIKKYGKLSKMGTLTIPEARHIIHICWQDKFYKFYWNKKVLDSDNNDESGIPDTLLINNYFIGQIYKQSKSKTNKAITYIGGNTKLKEICAMAKRSDKLMFFILHPEKAENLTNYVRAGKIYPPKTTWFEPKIRSGMVAKSF